MCAPFFWHGHVQPLFLKASIDAAFGKMNTHVVARADGRQRPLYPEMLDLLLRLNIRAAGPGDDGTELAMRTREVLEQFERNDDQQVLLLTILEHAPRARTHTCIPHVHGTCMACAQVFLLTIFEKLDERTAAEVDLSDGPNPDPNLNPNLT